MYVHREVTHLMAAFLVAVGESYQDVTDRAFGWTELGDAWQRLGLRLDVPGLVWSERLRIETARLGLTAGDGFVVFEGLPYEADRLTRQVLQDATTALASIEVGFLDIHRPGTRPLALGDSGPDVYFLQEFLLDEAHDAHFGPSLALRVKGFQQARNLPETGEMDQATWLSMFPERTVIVEPGDAGLWVRMVQSLLVALDYSANPVTSQYGTRTTRDVREMQKLHQLRPSGMIRGAEWGVLVHRPIDGFPLAD